MRDLHAMQRALFVVALAVLGLSVSPRQGAMAAPEVDREVFGYIPHWGMDYDFPHWELLTTVAYFAVSMDANGLATAYYDWGSDEMQNLVDEAHAHDVRLVATIQNFNDEEIATLLSDPTKRATAIETCLTLIAMHDADGVNIDFERVPLSVKSEFVTFMSDLKDAVDAAQPDGMAGHVTLAGPAIDGAGAYDFDQLLIHTDGIFIMGYDYYWGTSEPGPTAPYESSAKWGSKSSLTWTVADYLQWGGVENRAKIILGLPVYGHAYNVANDDVPGVNIDKTFKAAMSTGSFQSFAAANGGEIWDEEASAVYAHGEYKGRYVQAWNENLASLGMKMNLVNEHDLGGVGFWALGYENGLDGFWTEVSDQFGTIDEPVDEPDAGPTEPDATEPDATEPDGLAQDDTLAPIDDDSADGLGPLPEPDQGETELSQLRVGEATAGSTSSDTITTRTTRSGCQGGAGGFVGWPLVALTVLLVACRRSHER